MVRPLGMRGDWVMDNFKRPIAAPPAIFLVALFAGVGLGFVHSAPILPLAVQSVLGAAAIGGGVWLIRLSMIEIDRAGTTYDPYAPSTRLVTSGIYRHIRNPGYLGLAVIQLGFAILLDNYWIVVTLIGALLIINVFVVLREEDKLRRTFGEDYKAYFASSRRWI